MNVAAYCMYAVQVAVERGLVEPMAGGIHMLTHTGLRAVGEAEPSEADIEECMGALIKRGLIPEVEIAAVFKGLTPIGVTIQ